MIALILTSLQICFLVASLGVDDVLQSPRKVQLQPDMASDVRHIWKVEAEEAYYLTLYSSHDILKVDRAGKISKPFGSAPQASAFDSPLGIAGLADKLFIAEFGGHRIKSADSSTLEVRIIAGSSQGKCGFSGDGYSAEGALLCGPTFLAVDSQLGILFIDSINGRVRHIDLKLGTIHSVAAEGSWNSIAIILRSAEAEKELLLADESSVALLGTQSWKETKRCSISAIRSVLPVEDTILVVRNSSETANAQFHRWDDCRALSSFSAPTSNQHLVRSDSGSLELVIFGSQELVSQPTTGRRLQGDDPTISPTEYPTPEPTQAAWEHEPLSLSATAGTDHFFSIPSRTSLVPWPFPQSPLPFSSKLTTPCLVLPMTRVLLCTLLQRVFLR